MSFVIICNVPLTSLKDTVLDITSTAQPGRFRLLDCAHFERYKTLRICEFADFPPDIPYSAISYVWKGNPLDRDVDEDGEFAVAGAEDGDPISISVLRHTCVASLQEQSEYFWLDRLCIMQTDRADKAWQIQLMFEIYRRCNPCLVLPGGIRRLVSLYEETTWIRRAWTLQEVVAPERAVLLFSWTWGSTFLDDKEIKPSGTGAGGSAFFVTTEVIPCESAVATVAGTLAAIRGDRSAIFERRREHTVIKPRILGKSLVETDALNFVVTDQLKKPEFRAIREQAIWRSSMLRASKHPVDMVFSIMGLFGVVLDTKAFSNHDRLGATVALTKALLSRGRGAEWLAAAYLIPPCDQLSSFAQFPQTSVTGSVFMDTESGTREVSEFIPRMGTDGAYLSNVPTGSMDDEGYLVVNCLAARVVPLQSPNHFDSLDQKSYIHELHLIQIDGTERTALIAHDRSLWEMVDDTDASTSEALEPFRPGRIFAVWVGDGGALGRQLFFLTTIPRQLGRWRWKSINPADFIVSLYVSDSKPTAQARSQRGKHGRSTSAVLNRWVWDHQTRFRGRCSGIALIDPPCECDSRTRSLVRHFLQSPQ